MKLDAFIRYLSLTLALTAVTHSTQARDREDSGAVYTMDNAATANHVLAYRRGADGALTADALFPTGGSGTGSGLGSQGALALSANGRWLFVCNAGSDEISVFRVTATDLELTDKVSSEGRHPISLALHRNFLFVLNAGGQVGGQDNVTGFLFLAGRLLPLANSTHPLSDDNTNPAQVSFSSDGEVLIVTEKDTGIIDTFTVDNDGGITGAKHFQSSGQTPFGFAIRGRHLIVSEAFGGAADASAASSYELDDEGDLQVISASEPTTETSACWTVVSSNGRFAYTANTGSGSISGYRVAEDGALTRLNVDGVTGITGAGSATADMTLSVNGRYLYSRNGNGTISAFRVHADGSLSSVGIVGGLPEGATGLAGR